MYLERSIRRKLYIKGSKICLCSIILDEFLYKIIKNLFKKDSAVIWEYNNCGYIYEGYVAPELCLACAHPQGYFEVFVETY